MRPNVRWFPTTLVAIICGAALAVPAAAGSNRAAPGTMKIDSRLISTGAAPPAAGEAHFRSAGTDRRFSVEVEGLPSGAYDLLVGGIVQGLIIVNEMEEGEIRFDSRAPEEGSIEENEDSEVLLLTFDPRGRSLEVSQAGTIFLQARFPSRPSSGNRH